jgi:hypothetical protein
MPAASSPRKEPIADGPASRKAARQLEEKAQEQGHTELRAKERHPVPRKDIKKAAARTNPVQEKAKGGQRGEKQAIESLKRRTIYMILDPTKELTLEIGGASTTR